MKKTHVRVKALTALLALPMVVTTMVVPGGAQALSIHATTDVNTKLVDIDHRNSVSDRKEDHDNKKEKSEDKRDGHQGTSSASTTLSTSTRILPPGIVHAPGIEKRLENGKGLPAGLVKILDKFPNWNFDQWFNWGKNHGNGGHGTTTNSTSTSTTTNQTSLKFESFSISNIATSSAKVSVVSNFDTYAEIRYAISASVLDNASSTNTNSGVISVSDNVIAKTHTVALNSLTPNTKYYVQVVLRDAAGHMISKTKSFETGKVSSDIEAPKIFFNATRSVSQNSATLLWVTSERSDSQVWVSASTTVNTTLAPAQSSTDLGFIHSMTVSNLQASTTYQYIVKSKDAAGNSVTASGSFTTDR